MFPNFDKNHDPDFLEMLQELFGQANFPGVVIIEARLRQKFSDRDDEQEFFLSLCRQAHLESRISPNREDLLNSLSQHVKEAYQTENLHRASQTAKAYVTVLSQEEIEQFVRDTKYAEPLSSLHKAVLLADANLVRQLLSEGADPKEQDQFQNPIALLAAKVLDENSFLGVYEALKINGNAFDAFLPNQEFVRAVLTHQNFSEITRIMRDFKDNFSLPKNVSDSLGMVFAQTEYTGIHKRAQKILRDSSLTVDETLLALGALVDALEEFDLNAGGYLAHLRPHLTGQKTLEIIPILARIAATAGENFSSHPNEPEFLSLIDTSSEELQIRTARLVRSIERRYTGFGNFNRTVSFQSDNYQTIGNLTFSHIKYTFDARSIKLSLIGETETVTPSLFELAGFKRIESRESDYTLDAEGKKVQLYGQGFELDDNAKKNILVTTFDNDIQVTKTVPQKSYFEMRRAYMMYSDEWGTLLIENSSPFFGRGTLGGPCFISPYGIGNGFSRENLRNLSKEFIEEYFIPFIRAYEGSEGSYRHIHKDAQHHLAHIQAILEHYEKQKFDTSDDTAWKDGKLVGAYRSPLFSQVVEYLSKAHHEKKMGNDKVIVPALGLIDRKDPMQPLFPFISPYGERVHMLEVDDLILEGLADLMHSEGPQTELLDRTGLRAFVQTALEQQAHLILLNPHTLQGKRYAGN